MCFLRCSVLHAVLCVLRSSVCVVAWCSLLFCVSNSFRTVPCCCRHRRSMVSRGIPCRSALLCDAWHGRGVGDRIVLAWVARAWRGHGMGLACEPPAAADPRTWGSVRHNPRPRDAVVHTYVPAAFLAPSDSADACQTPGTTASKTEAVTFVMLEQNHPSKYRATPNKRWDFYSDYL
eukprot:gene14969-biopygen6629